MKKQQSQHDYYELEAEHEKIPVGLYDRSKPTSFYKKMYLLLELITFCLLTFRIDYLRQPGYLVRHWKFMLVWVTYSFGVLIIAMVCPWGHWSRSLAPLFLFLFFWVYYYIGFTWFLSSRWRLMLLDRWGKARVIQYSELIICTFWGGGAISFYAMSNAYVSLLPPPSQWLFFSSAVLNGLGYCLIFFGLSFKVWPTWLIGYNSYFWRDQVLGVPNESFVDSSLYRWFKHPTYSVGYFQAYGTALLLHSTAGLIGAFVMHCGIFIFVRYAEEPGIRRLYG